MNKDYLPFYNNLNEKDKTFWLERSKEELIDHLVSNIKNGEVLLSRIEKATEFIYENAYDTERENCIDDLWGDIPKLLKILKGDIDEGNN